LIKHFRFRVQPELHQGVGCQQRDVMAGSAIDLDEIASPKILDRVRYNGRIPASDRPMRQKPGWTQIILCRSYMLRMSASVLCG
jgi:hypothetical protein